MPYSHASEEAAPARKGFLSLSPAPKVESSRQKRFESYISPLRL